MNNCRYEIQISQWEVDRRSLLSHELRTGMLWNHRKTKQYRLKSARYSPLLERQARISRDLAQADIPKHAELYAVMSCRQLCEDVATKLPRELRDMVYGEILRSTGDMLPTSYVLAPRSSWTMPAEATVSAWKSLTAKSLFQFGLPKEFSHCWEVGYVGPTVRKELVDTCYYVKTLHFGDDFEGPPSLLSELMAYPEDAEANVLAVEFPARDFVRNVEMTLKWHKYRATENPEPVPTLRAFESLKLLKPGATIKVSLRGTGFHGLRRTLKTSDTARFKELCMSLWPLLQSLRDHVHVVELGIELDVVTQLREWNLLPEQYRLL